MTRSIDLSNAASFMSAYCAVWTGPTTSPRGKLCKEKCDYSLYLSMARSDQILTSFDARKLNLNYAKQELLWYLRGNRFDDSIEQYADAWAKIKQGDGAYNSNYGQYIFDGISFDWVINCLAHDASSRQASIVLLRPWHLEEGNPDVVCTYGMNFRIRGSRYNERQLDMTVMMRSNDVIWGLTNDSFCFTMIYRMVYALLKVQYPDLKPGLYHHFANSLHVYQRHFQMIDDIIKGGLDEYTKIDVPWPTDDEVRSILSQPRWQDRSNVQGPMTLWLNDVSPKP